MQEGDAGTHHQLRFGKIGRELAEMLHAEGGWEIRVRIGESDLLACFTAGGFEGGFFFGVGSAWVVVRLWFMANVMRVGF